MNNTREKKKTMMFSIIFIIIFLMIGAFIGFLSAKFIFEGKKYSGKTFIFGLLLIYVFIMVSTYLQIIIHELGHLLFGKLSGYSFLSFRVGKIILYKDGDKLKISKYHLPGTGGQCIMMPPQREDEKPPYLMYNLGGSIANLLLSLIAIPILIWMVQNKIQGSIVAAIVPFMAIGIYLALVNIIPINMGTPNDGYNIYSIKRDENAHRAFYHQLRNVGFIMMGIELKDIKPLILPSDANISNPLITNMFLYEYSYYLSHLDWGNAKAIADRIMKEEDNIATIFRNESNAERLYLELILNENKEIVNELYTKELNKYIQATKSTMDKQRVMIAYEALYNDDIHKAEELYHKMKSKAVSYPFKGIVHMEINLAEKVFEIYKQRQIEKGVEE